MSEWQPIKTAPKDGTEVLLLFADEPLWIVAFFGPDSQKKSSEICWRCKWDHESLHQGYEEPTHWMPLPEPPK